jgi:hypothetical protein
MIEQKISLHTTRSVVECNNISAYATFDIGQTCMSG